MIQSLLHLLAILIGGYYTNKNSRDAVAKIEKFYQEKESKDI